MIYPPLVDFPSLSPKYGKTSSLSSKLKQKLHVISMKVVSMERVMKNKIRIAMKQIQTSPMFLTHLKNPRILTNPLLFISAFFFTWEGGGEDIDNE